MVLGAGMLMKPSGLLFAAGGPPGSIEPRSLKSDGTKYGKYIFIPSEEPEVTERGANIIDLGSNWVPGCNMSAITKRFLPPGPMPAHSAPEKHEDVQEVLCMLGNNPDDPMDLGGEAEFFMGKGKLLEKYPLLTRSAVVYAPTGQWHWPWQVKKIRTPITWVQFNITTRGQAATGAAQGRATGAGGGKDDLPPTASSEPLSEEARAKAKTSGYIFNNLVLSGVGVERQNPKGGKWIAYMDATMIAEAPLLRILRYRPEEAPYSIINTQTHEYGTFLLLYGIDHNDPSYLGAEVELSIGPEKEKHTINKSALVYVPANKVHGPFIVKKAQKPFLFVEVVSGPEMPGAVYDNRY